MFPLVSGTMLLMTDENRKLLGREVVARRRELGMTTTKSLAEAAGLSPRMLGDVENGRRSNFSDGAKMQIERALKWMHGSIDEVLAGRQPKEVEPTTGAPPGGISIQIDLTAIPGDALVEEIRRRMKTDLEYLTGKPVRRWTGLVEIAESPGIPERLSGDPKPGAGGDEAHGG